MNLRTIFRENLRSRAIRLSLERVSDSYRDEPLRLVEVGSMYNEEQGLSTYVIADFLANRPKGGKFVSVDLDQDHIKASSAIIQRHNPALMRWVEYRHGHSLRVLPKLLAEFGTVHVALLDGSEHPEVCLVEFEETLKHLASDGVILVDDAQPIPVSQEYPLPRPLGKLTLILPMLIVGNYLRNRGTVRASASDVGDPSTVPDAAFIKQLDGLPVDAVGASFCVMGTWHRMLAYGNPRFVAMAEALTDVGLLRRTAGRLLSRLGLGS